MTLFFHSWENVLRVLITAIIAYPGLIILLRLSGKRSLAKLNMFDFIVTVALGSAFASVIVSENATIIDGIIIFGILLTAQFLITRASLKWKLISKWIKSEPTLLFRDGEFLEDAMHQVRILEQEIYAEIRLQGHACLNNVHAVVLETNGTVSVIGKTPCDIQHSTLKYVANYEPKNA